MNLGCEITQFYVVNFLYASMPFWRSHDSHSVRHDHQSSLSLESFLICLG